MLNLIRHFVYAAFFAGLAYACGATAQPVLPALNQSHSDLSLPGKHVWMDLATPNVNGQKKFYGDVFGWTFRSPGNTPDNYTVIYNGSRAIGGLFEYVPPGGEQDGAVWINLFAVADARKAAEQITELGGSLVAAPVSIPKRGKHALLMDPDEAIFGVLESSSGDPPDQHIDIGEVFWIDLFTHDQQAMGAFYSKIINVETSSQNITRDVDKIILNVDGLPRAGIVPVDDEANRSAWVAYIRVADVEASLKKVVDGGGFAIIPPSAELLDGNLAVVVDPHGGVIGLVRWDDDDQEVVQ